jgi:hypothetical protein
MDFTRSLMFRNFTRVPALRRVTVWETRTPSPVLFIQGTPLRSTRSFFVFSFTRAATMLRNSSASGPPETRPPISRITTSPSSIRRTFITKHSLSHLRSPQV